MKNKHHIYSPVAFMLLMAAIITSAFMLAISPGVGCIYADHHDTEAYCSRIQLSVTNNGVARTDWPVAVEINAAQLTSAQLISTGGYDALSVNASRQAIPMTIQDMNTTPGPSRWWVVLDSIPATSTSIAYIYHGNPYVARNNGFYFDGVDDYASTTDAAILDVTDDFELIVVADTGTPDQAGELVDKLDAATASGYRLEVAATSTGQVAFTVANGGAPHTIAADWDGTLTEIRARFDASATNDMTLEYRTSTAVGWVSQASDDAGFASVATNSTNFVMGDGFEGSISSVKLQTDAGGVQVLYQFNPLNVFESTFGTAANGWVYTGDITAEHGTVVDAYYSITRNQDNLTVAVGPSSPTTASTAVTVTIESADILGDATNINLFADPDPAAMLPFFGVLEAGRTRGGIPHTPYYILVLGFIAVVVAAGAYKLTNNFEISAGVGAAIMVFGAVGGVLSPFVPLVFAFAAVGIWLIRRWATD